MSKIMSKIFAFLKKRWKLLLLLLIIFVVVILAVMNGQAKKQAQFIEVAVERQDLQKNLEVSGILDAKEHVYMSFIAGGKLVYLGAKEGDWVKKWQTIASIDARDLQKNLQKSLNVYSNDRLDWEEVERANKDQVLTEEELRDLKQEQNRLNNTVLDVELVSVAISNSVMSAPFEGILLSVPSPVTGVVLGPTSTFELINPKTLIIRAEVDEVDIALLRTGQKATLNFDAYPDEFVETTISQIALKTVQSSAGTVFRIELPLLGVEELSKYRLGMNTDVAIELENKSNVLVIPLIATESRDGNNYVKVKDGSRQGFREQQVELGLESDELVEVLSGLNEADIILIEE